MDKENTDRENVALDLVNGPFTIMVTGGAGFIGVNLVAMILERYPSAKVVVYDAGGYAANKGRIYELQEKYTSARLATWWSHTADFNSVSDCLEKHRPDYIVNLAASSHVDNSISTPLTTFNDNIAGTWTLLEHARRHRDKYCKGTVYRFLHVSTDEVFGPVSEPHSSYEFFPYNPTSPYAASKAAADHIVRSYIKTYNFPALITHASNNYGPWQHAEKFIPTVILNALQGKDIPIYGDGKQRRDWIYVDDHCDALLYVLQHGKVGESYNIGSGSTIPNIELAEYICEVVDRITGTAYSKKLIKHVKDRPAHDVRYCLNINKIDALGWKRKTLMTRYNENSGMPAGLEHTVAWYANKLLQK